MKFIALVSSSLILSLSLGMSGAIAHVGHGDEFQAQGGINRVAVNDETDPLLGIQVEPIAAAADGSTAILIPVTALVDDNDRQLVFVQYENFYEPVDVITGNTQGELIEITSGVTVGEQLVTQGSLSLYAESRKTQADAAVDTLPVEASVPTSETAAPGPETVPAESLGEVAVAQTDTVEAQQTGLPLKTLAIGGGGLILTGGAIAWVTGKRNQKEGASN